MADLRPLIKRFVLCFYLKWSNNSYVASSDRLIWMIFAVYTILNFRFTKLLSWRMQTSLFDSFQKAMKLWLEKEAFSSVEAKNRNWSQPNRSGRRPPWKRDLNQQDMNPWPISPLLWSKRADCPIRVDPQRWEACQDWALMRKRPSYKWSLHLWVRIFLEVWDHTESGNLQVVKNLSQAPLLRVELMEQLMKVCVKI